MSSIRFDTLINEFPEERETLDKLARVIQQDNADYSEEFTVSRLFAQTEPSSKRVLVSILQHLCDVGVLTRVVRVVSPGNGGIADFDSVADLPDEILDWRTGEMVEVEMDRVQQIYKLQG
jgi:hypothetical protein